MDRPSSLRLGKVAEHGMTTVFGSVQALRKKWVRHVVEEHGRQRTLENGRGRRCESSTEKHWGRLRW
jgi:hypothetical protein